MKVTGPQQPLRYLILAVFGLGLFATACLAAPVGVKALLSDAGKYLGRQIEVEGRVEKWLEAGDAGKPGSYLLIDNFGDAVAIRASAPLPAVGEKMRVAGLLALDAGGGKYFIQSVNAVSASAGDPGGSLHQGAERDPDGKEGVPFYSRPSFKRKLAMVVAITAAMLLFIIGVALKVKKSRRKVLDIPEFTFDEINTVYIDSNGKFAKAADEEADEQTRLMLPGHYEITKGPADLQGRRIYLATEVTKIGREESGVDKSNGWICLPARMSTVSRHQADLLYKDGDYCVENRSKTNSTLVNGIALPLDQGVKVKNLDTISFGGVELTYMGPQ